jgi:hypothetical protein
MSENTSPPQSFRSTPHIRLNSGRHDPFVDLEEGPNSPKQPTSTRSLIPPGPQSPNLPPGTALASPYSASRAADSSELLLPPPRNLRSRDGSEPRSPVESVISSRRTSWDSEVDSRAYPYDPFSDSRAPSRADSEDDNVNTQTVSEKYNIMPSEGLLLFPEDVEKDDYLHNPDPNDKDRDCDICNPRGLANVGGLALLTIGIMALFIGYPVAYGSFPFKETVDLFPANESLFLRSTFVQKLTAPTNTQCNGDPMCLDAGQIPLLKNIRTGLIDPDTPDSVKSIKAANGKEWNLVVSSVRGHAVMVAHTSVVF